MSVRIYKPARNAMQSGKAKYDNWVLEFVAAAPRTVDPLMGWTSSGDTRSQVKLTFDTKEEAIAYCEKHGIPYQVADTKTAPRQGMSYADNFAYNRIGRWTH